MYRLKSDIARKKTFVGGSYIASGKNGIWKKKLIF